MSKTVATFTAQLVTFSTSVPFTEVISRLETAVHKEDSNGRVFPALGAAKSKEDVGKAIHDLIGDDDFLYISEVPHHWMKHYKPGTGKVVVYNIGNPLTASALMLQDIRAGYNIPLRLLVCEKENNAGTDVHYHLPSAVSTIADNADLKAAGEVFDQKLEALVRKVTAETA